MPPLNSVKVKLCLVGDSAVGKTSLVRRFVHNEFDDNYIQTLGAKIVKREILVDIRGQPMTAVLSILDIMGEPSFLDLLKEAFFRAVQGIVAVGDLTRPATVWALGDWIKAARSVSGHVPVVILGNKVDLPVAEGALEALRDISEALRMPSWKTSAKTGAYVGPAFAWIAQAAVESALQLRGDEPIAASALRPKA